MEVQSLAHQVKACSKCLCFKSLECFSWNKKYSCYQSICKSCHSLLTADWKKRNPDKVKLAAQKRIEKIKIQRATNPKPIKAKKPTKDEIRQHIRQNLKCVSCGSVFAFLKRKGGNPKVCSENCRKVYQREYQRRYAQEVLDSGHLSFDARSAARRMEAAERAGLIHSAHVRLYERTFTPGQRKVLKCKTCGHEFRRMDAKIDSRNCCSCPVCNESPGRSREKRLSANRQRYARNADVYREKQRIRMRESGYCREYAKRNRAKLNEAKRLARIRGTALGGKPAKHDSHVKAWAKWCKEQRDRPVLHDAHVREWKSDAARHFRWRYRYDPEFNLKQRIRAAMRKLKWADTYAYRHASTLVKKNVNDKTFAELVGYSVSDLRAHLERQFSRGMSWEKFCDGQIHIDHIKPRSSFDLTDPANVKTCWCLSNLQPLWAKDNIRKGNKHHFLL